MDKIAIIKFAKQPRTYNFSLGQLDAHVGDQVIVSTSKGLQIGKIERMQPTANQEYEQVIRKATEKDIKKAEKIADEEKEALKICREKVASEKLAMHLVAARYSFDKETLTFTFFADNRVDFRNLLKLLAKEFKTRIELIQIGVRDKAKETGGLGSCGQELCCSRFLTKLDNISINMAKNQGLALNPNKINGVCGRLLCCLNYENDYYEKCKKQMPKVNSVINTEYGKGKVIKVDCMKRSYNVELNNGEIVTIEKDDKK